MGFHVALFSEATVMFYHLERGVSSAGKFFFATDCSGMEIKQLRMAEKAAGRRVHFPSRRRRISMA